MDNSMHLIPTITIMGYIINPILFFLNFYNTSNKDHQPLFCLTSNQPFQLNKYNRKH